MSDGHQELSSPKPNRLQVFSRQVIVDKILRDTRNNIGPSILVFLLLVLDNLWYEIATMNLRGKVSSKNVISLELLIRTKLEQN